MFCLLSFLFNLFLKNFSHHMKSTSNCCGGQCSLKKCCDVFQVLAWNLEPGISVRQSGRVTYLSLIFQYQFACSICGATSSRKSCIFKFSFTFGFVVDGIYNSNSESMLLLFLVCWEFYPLYCNFM